MTALPPEDQPDTVDIGPVRDIPIIEADDPRFEDERRASSRARAKAQAMYSADELLRGMRDSDWMVRHEVVDRLIVRAHDDERTIPTLVEAAADEVSAVRDAVVMGLRYFDDARAANAVRRALDDDDAEVRWSARFVVENSPSAGQE